MKYRTAQPYVASYVLLERDGKYAFLLRSNTNWMNNYYGLVAGKVEKNESFTQAAIREAREEANVVLEADQLEQVLMCHRREPDEEMSWVDVVFRAKHWRGEAINAEPQMHCELAWFALDQLPDNTIPSLKFMLENILAGNTYCEYGWSDER